jgi:hypothetical protein
VRWPVGVYLVALVIGGGQLFRVVFFAARGDWVQTGAALILTAAMFGLAASIGMRLGMPPGAGGGRGGRPRPAPGPRPPPAGAPPRPRRLLRGAGVPRPLRGVLPLVGGADDDVLWIPGVAAREGSAPAHDGVRVWLAPLTADG